MFKRKPAYYSVFALRDGTIWFASLTKKPKKTKGRPPEVDQDGIHNWYLDEELSAGTAPWARAVRHGAVVNNLNLKRVLRQQIEPKLDELLNRLTAVEERLQKLADRLEVE